MLRLYLAAPFETQRAMRGLATILNLTHEFDVQARWLDEPENDPLTWPEKAKRDLEDIGAADVVVVYNPEGFYNKGTGGRHVEFGVALAYGKPLVLFGGAPSNVFHTCPRVWHAETFEQLTFILRSREVYYA